MANQRVGNEPFVFPRRMQSSGPEAVQLFACCLAHDEPRVIRARRHQS